MNLYLARIFRNKIYFNIARILRVLLDRMTDTAHSRQLSKINHFVKIQHCHCTACIERKSKTEKRKEYQNTIMAFSRPYTLRQLKLGCEVSGIKLSDKLSNEIVEMIKQGTICYLFLKAFVFYNDFIHIEM